MVTWRRGFPPTEVGRRNLFRIDWRGFAQWLGGGGSPIVLRGDELFGSKSVATLRQETFGELLGGLFGSVAEKASFGSFSRAQAQVI